MTEQQEENRKEMEKVQEKLLDDNIKNNRKRLKGKTHKEYNKKSKVTKGKKTVNVTDKDKSEHLCAYELYRLKKVKRNKAKIKELEAKYTGEQKQFNDYILRLYFNLF